MIFNFSLIKKNKKFKQFYGILNKNPQKKGFVIKARLQTPRKPNSAKRPVAKMALTNRRYVVAHIPGINHNVRKHSHILIRGGGARDLPGVYHTCIRGVLDLTCVLNRFNRRSIYGIKIPDSKINKVRRRFRLNKVK
jgi:small subunit ribosomal protein S12